MAKEVSESKLKGSLSLKEEKGGKKKEGNHLLQREASCPNHLCWTEVTFLLSFGGDMGCL